MLLGQKVVRNPLIKRHPEAMCTALARHDALIREAIESANGYVIKAIGDAFYRSFPVETGAGGSSPGGNF